MTTQTPLELVRSKIDTAQKTLDAANQQVDRATLLIDNLKEVEHALATDENKSDTVADRLKPGQIEERVTEILSGPSLPHSGVTFSLMLADTGFKEGSLRAALKRMTDAGTVILTGEYYTLKKADQSARGHHQENL